MRRLRQGFILIKDFLEFRKRIKNDAKNTKTKDKKILIKVKNPNLYHRFFYLFLKQFQLSDYKIYFPMNFEQYRNIKHNNLYFSWIVKEKGLVSIAEPKDANCTIIEDDNLSADYFLDFFSNQNQETGYHFPMTFHPIMFHRNLNEKKIQHSHQRVNSLFTFGNFEKENYSEIDKTPFKLINRYQLLQFFSRKTNFVSINSSNELIKIVKEKPEKKYIFVEKEYHSIPIENIREKLSKFNFFLACPGVVMPHCHNIIEALSVQTIPILQEDYAKMFYPNLQHEKEVFTFKAFEDLDILTKTLFNITPSQLNEMRENIRIYYQNHLIPHAIIAKTLKNIKEDNKIYINAEHRSVNLISS